MVWQHYVEAVSGAGGAPVVFPVDDCYVSDPELALDAVDGLAPHRRARSRGHLLRRATGSRERAGRPTARPGRAGARRRRARARSAAARRLPGHAAAQRRARRRHRPAPRRPGRPPPRRARRLRRPPESRRSPDRRWRGSSARPRSRSARITTRASSRSPTGSASPAHSPDGLVEAVETPDARFCVAVLWHPEENLRRRRRRALRGAGRRRGSPPRRGGRVKRVRVEHGGEVVDGTLDGDEIVAHRRHPNRRRRRRLARARWCPGKIVATHLSYRSRCRRVPMARPPAAPSYFLKPPSSLSHHGADVARPRGCRFLNYEGEIGLVIGRRALGVSIERGPRPRRRVTRSPTTSASTTSATSIAARCCGSRARTASARSGR